MIEEFDEYDRQLIPRWTTYSTNSMISSKDDDGSIPSLFTGSFEKAKADWIKNKSIGFAYDVVTFGKLSGRENDKSYVECLKSLSKTQFYSFFVKEEMQDCTMPSVDKNVIYSLIHNNRLLLNATPNNALSWIDQAYYYSIIGQERNAEKCISTALSLNNANSYILRSAASFYNHMKEPEKALFVLRHSEFYDSDPRIIAADISISNANGIKKKTKKRLSFDISPVSSELFAVYSTMESASGNKKKAKKLMTEALYFPNENIVAQKVSLEKQFGSFNLITPENIPCEYEAKAKLLYYTRDYIQSEIESFNWFLFQPFSVEAATFSSSLNLSFFKNYDRALSVLELANLINPGNPSIKNNLAYCYACTGDYLKAREQLDSVNYSALDPYTRYLLMATEGFLAYKTGDHNSGVSLYKNAIEGFSILSNQFCVSKATYILGTLVLDSNKEEGLKLINEAYSIAEKNRLDYLITIIKKDGLYCPIQ